MYRINEEAIEKEAEKLKSFLRKVVGETLEYMGEEEEDEEVIPSFWNKQEVLRTVWQYIGESQDVQEDLAKIAARVIMSSLE